MLINILGLKELMQAIYKLHLEHTTRGRHLEVNLTKETKLARYVK